MRRFRRRSPDAGARRPRAEGELQASETLQQVAFVLARQPGAMQLRYMQTLGAIAGDKSSTIVFPLPIELLDVVAAHARTRA